MNLYFTIFSYNDPMMNLYFTSSFKLIPISYIIPFKEHASDKSGFMEGASSCWGRCVGYIYIYRERERGRERMRER